MSEPLLAKRYALMQLLGRGGMGEVWGALDTQTGLPCAVKVLRAVGESDAVMAKRFLREAERTASIHHPNVVRCTDFGEDESGGLYLVMELLEGETLHARLKKGGPWPLLETFALMRVLGDALSAVHQKGVVHRDIKPSNLMLCAPNDALRLIDFGIARSVDDDTQLTSTGMLVGTAEYCSPEQIRGQPIGQWTDQYSVGVMLFRMLTGSLPFEGPGLAALMFQQVYAPPPTLRSRGLDASQALEDVVQRTLSKEPGRRFPSMGALVEALGDAVAGRAPPTVERPLTGPVRTPTATPRDNLEAPHAQGVITALLFAMDLAALHRPKDPVLSRVRAWLRLAIEDLLLREGRLELTVDDLVLLVNGRRIVVAPESVQRLQAVHRRLEELGIRSLVASKPPTEADLDVLLEVFSRSTSLTAAASRLTSLRLVESGVATVGRPPRASASSAEEWTRTLAKVDRLIKAVAADEAFDSAALIDHVRAMAEAMADPKHEFVGLAVLQRAASPASRRVNTAWLAAFVARDLGLATEHIESLVFSALVSHPVLHQVSARDQLADVWSVLTAVLREGGLSPLAWHRLLAAADRVAVAEQPPQFLMASPRSRLLTWCAWADAVWSDDSAADGAAVAVRVASEGAAFLDDVWPVVRRTLESLEVGAVRSGNRQVPARRCARSVGGEPSQTIAAALRASHEPSLPRLVQVVSSTVRRHPRELRRLPELVDGLLLQGVSSGAADLLSGLMAARGRDDGFDRELFLMRTALGHIDRLRFLLWLDDGSLDSTRATARLLSLLDASAAANVAEVLVAHPTREGRALLTDALVTLASPPAVLERARATPQDLAALSPALHRLGVPVTRQLQAAVAQADPKLTLDLLSALAAIGTAEARRTLAEALGHSESRVRMHALRLLAHMQAGVGADDLVAYVGNAGFASRPDAEREEGYAALLAVGTPPCEGALLGVLNAPSGLLNRRRVNAERQRVLAVVSKVPSLVGVRVLTQFSAQAAAHGADIATATTEALTTVRRRLVEAP